MQLIRGIHNLIRSQVSASVVTLGTFDGVHRGHQAVLQQVKQQARDAGLPAVVMVFEPQPAEFFAGHRAPARLTSLREKCAVLAELGIDIVCCLHFDRQLAGLSAEDFVRELLVEGLGVRHLVVGDDLRFGRDRQGDIHLLRRLSQQYSYELSETQSCLQAGERVSSTLIRSALAAGELDTADRMLGRPYSLRGRIIHGEKLGRQLSFPTANVAMNRTVSAVKGIFAVRVLELEEQPLDGVAYIGRRPIVDGNRELLEVHLFDYDRQCYGRHIHAQLLKKLRDDRHFDSLEALKQQIARDAQQAREFILNRAARAAS